MTRYDNNGQINKSAMKSKKKYMKVMSVSTYFVNSESTGPIIYPLLNYGMQMQIYIPTSL